MSTREEKADGPLRKGTDGKGPLGGLPVSTIVVIAIAVVAVVSLLFLRGDDGDGEAAGDGTQVEETVETQPAGDGTQAEKTVELVSDDELPAVVADVGYDVYWLGPRVGVQYEVTVITDGRTYIRYLPEAEEAETKKPYPTVGSYQQDNAVQVLRELATESGGEIFEVGGGGTAFARTDTDTGVYVAYPGSDSQVEVFDPEPGEARDLVESGAVVPVE